MWVEREREREIGIEETKGFLFLYESIRTAKRTTLSRGHNQSFGIDRILSLGLVGDGVWEDPPTLWRAQDDILSMPPPLLLG